MAMCFALQSLKSCTFGSSIINSIRSRITSHTFMRAYPSPTSRCFASNALPVISLSTSTLSGAKLLRQCYAPKYYSRNKATTGKGNFEKMNSNVKQDVTVFTYENTRFFKMMTTFGVAQFFFWVNLAYMCYSDVGKGSSSAVVPESKQGSFWAGVIELQSKYKYRIAVACVALGYMVLFFTTIYPLRTVAKLTLLKGGEMVRLTTYTHFGHMKAYSIPLKEISCAQSRHAKGAQMSMKVRGRWFYYMLDKRDGKFHNAELFDYVVGINRFSK